jgi:glycosyltransferase involved in cell wall biosynthesis
MRIRILHAISSLDLRSGGPAVALAGLVQGQREAGLDVSVVATFRGNTTRDLAESLLRTGIPVEMVGPCHGTLCRHPDLGPTVHRMIGAADLVHIHALYEEVQHLAARVAARLGKPYVIRPCGMLDAWSLRRQRLKKVMYMAWRLRRNLDRAAAIHYTTEMERLGSSPLKLRAAMIVEPNGVLFDDFRNLPTRGSFRVTQPAVSDHPLVMFLGRVHPGKGLEYLIPALAACNVQEARLVVVGPDSGNHMYAMQRLAAVHGVADRVIFTGLLRGADRVAALVDADVFALPSDHENFGIAIAEAMAAALPVVISNEVGIAADVAAAGAGSVVPRDPARIAAELNRWLGDITMRRRAGESGRQFVFERYDWTHIGHRWANHYAKILRSHETA